MSIKSRGSRPSRKQIKPISELPLAQAVGEAAEEEGEVLMPSVPIGSLGNPDFVAYGSDEHSALLGFDPETMESLFSFETVPEEIKDVFVNTRKRWLEKNSEVTHGQGKQGVIPPMWDPDNLPEFVERVV